MDEFETLYRQYAEALLRFAWGLSGDRSTAEDIVAETFARIVTRAPRIETTTALAYLLTVARNVYLSGRRRRRWEVPLTDDLPAAPIDPDGLLDDRDRLQAVLEALHRLPEGERAALLLRVDQNLSYREIAVALGTTEGAAKVRVHRARLRLTRTLAPQEQGRKT